jgi:hypothetical protein
VRYVTGSTAFIVTSSSNSFQEHHHLDTTGEPMPQTCRQYWWNLQGRCTLNFNWDAINHDSVVLITASEYKPNPPDPAHSPRFVGAANIGVENISPHSPPFDPNHGVTVVVDVDWGSPLHVVTDITVLDQPPVDIEVQSG